MSTVTNNPLPLWGSAVKAPTLAKLRQYANDPVLQRLRPRGMPILFEDEGPEMGESDLHTRTCDILLYGAGFHFAGQAEYRVFGNLNLHYSETEPEAYVSPDLMVVQPPGTLPDKVTSYRIGQEGPAPVLVAEVLSRRTYQQGDLTEKPVLYAALAVEEYILVDVTGEMLPEKLILLRRQANGSWADEQDEDGGVTSRLGFRLLVEADGQLRVLDAQSGKRYARPGEAQAAADGWAAEVKARRKAERAARAEAKARLQAEERVQALEEELARRRRKGRKGKGP
ncbi:MAG: Uma2 family endonuclease [Gemmataceae bacterium]|nr:Uma2 family endonuclease [Gemmataceae bacterium]